MVSFMPHAGQGKEIVSVAIELMLNYELFGGKSILQQS
jgi:hypothetical protein